MQMPAVVRYESTKETLFLTETGMEKPWRILVLGAGGTGSEMIDALCRLDYALGHLSHPGLKLTIQDGDVVAAANVGRQRFLPADVGANKAELLARRYGVLLGMNVRYLSEMAVMRHVAQFDEFDLIITCVDRATMRVKIADYWRTRRCETMWLDLGNGQFSGQCCLGHLGIPKNSRVPNVLDLFPSIRTMRDDDQPSCSVAEALQSQMIFVNRWMADAAVALLTQLFTQGSVRQHGAFVDMKALRMSPMALGSTTWNMLCADYDSPPSKKKPGKAKSTIAA